MKVLDHEQGSPEWFAARVGKVTASRMGDVIAKGRSGAPSLTRAAYMGELIAEILSGQPCNSFQGNADTERGIELEPSARASYESQRGVFVDSIGLVVHPTIERSAASPDGLVGEEGLLEIKCPRPHVHLEYLLSGEPPSKYVPQMGWQLACTGREWVDFVSYCPVFPKDMQMFIVRFAPSQNYLDSLESAVGEFLKEMDEKLERIASLRKQ